MPRTKHAAEPSSLEESYASDDFLPDSDHHTDSASDLEEDEWPEDSAATLEQQSSPASISSSRTRPKRKLIVEPEQPRRSPRVNSRASSLEPSLVMPSLYQSTAKDVRTTPMSASSQPRRRNLASSSVETPSRQRRTAPSVTQEPRRSRKVDASTGATRAPAEVEPFVILNTIWQIISPTVKFILSILGMMLAIAKPIIAVVGTIMAIWMILKSVQSSFYSALSPICEIPGATFLHLPFCGPRTLYEGPVEFEQLINAQSAFEDVLSSTNEIAGLPYDMKRSEASIRDLRSVIQYSSLPSRNEMSFEFNGFIQSARQASSDLTRFDTKIGGAVDKIISTNRWTLQVLNSIRTEEASRGSVSRFIDGINPLANSLSSQQRVLTQYIRHTGAVEDQVSGVIHEAQGLLMLLQSLDERLDTLASIAARDGYTVKDSRDELFSSLWTKLGGNRNVKAKLNENLKLLDSVSQYQRAAWKHVSDTIIKLQEMAAQLEDLRERVAAPGVVGVQADLPLELHIENILLGVERLDGVRGESQRVQGDLYRKMVAGVEGADRDGNLVDAGSEIPVVRVKSL